MKGVIDGTVFIGYVRKSFRTELKTGKYNRNICKSALH